MGKIIAILGVGAPLGKILDPPLSGVRAGDVPLKSTTASVNGSLITKSCHNDSYRSGGSRISPRRGCQLPRGRQHTILPKFPKNCMKLKEFGPSGGGRASKILLCRSTTVQVWIQDLVKGEPQLLRPKVANVVQQSHMSEASNLQQGSRALKLWGF